MKATVRRVSFDQYRRILAVSDIHGKRDWLEALLEKAGFSDQDALVLLGDLVERGEESLATLRYVMQLCRRENVFVVMGNCDILALELWPGPHGVLDYLSVHPESLMLQMAKEGGFVPRKDEDLKAFGFFLRKNFPAEMAFLKEGPTVLETENYVFVHGGVPTYERMETLNAWQCMKNDDFLSQGLSFPKYCVVGHWPTSLYCDKIPCCNPIILTQRRIAAIDGGCGVAPGGQLNALVLPPDSSGSFTFFSYDGYPVCTALDAQREGPDPVTICWTDNAVDVLKRGTDFCFCRQKSTGRTLWVPSSYLRTCGGESRCENITDYRLGVTPGDVLSVVEKTSRGCLVKKEGVIGWYRGRLE